MRGFNKVILMGNLTRDPAMRQTGGGITVCDFGVAINREWLKDGQKQKETTFIDAVAFGKTADTIGKYFAKGDPIFIEGRLKQEQWEDKQTGAKRSKIGVVVDNFQFITNKATRQDDDGQPQSTAAPVDDDIPF